MTLPHVCLTLDCLLCRAQGLASMIATAVLTSQSWTTTVTLSQILTKLVMYSGAIALVGYLGYRAFMWFFYDRHASRRVNKRRSV